jgi:IPT/TIG domain
VMVQGTGLTNTIEVTIGGVVAPNLVQMTDQEVLVNMPLAVPLDTPLDVTVTAPGGSATMTEALVRIPILTASGVSPSSAATDDTVTITGTGFIDPMVVYLFSATTSNEYDPDSVTVVDDSTITFPMPGGIDPADVGGPPMRVGLIRQTDEARAQMDGALSAAAPFAVTLVSPDMLISTVPMPITITGSGFTGATAVDLIRVSNQAVSACTNVVVVNDSTITATATAPAGGTNRYDCRVTKGSDTATLPSACGANSPTITLVTPNPIVGADATPGMSLVGTLFQQMGTIGVSLASDVKVACTNVVVVSDTSITFDFPGGIAASGNVAIRLNIPGGVEVFPGANPPLVAT